MKVLSVLIMGLVTIFYQPCVWAMPVKQALCQLGHSFVASKKHSITLESIEMVDALGRYTRKSTTVIEIESTEQGSGKARQSTEPQVKQVEGKGEVWI